MTGVGSSKPVASVSETQSLAIEHLTEHLTNVSRDMLAPDDPPAGTAAPEKRIGINITLEENFHRAMKKVLLTYDDTWQTTIYGLLSVWLQVNVHNRVLSPRDVEGIPNIKVSPDEAEP